MSFWFSTPPALRRGAQRIHFGLAVLLVSVPALLRSEDLPRKATDAELRIRGIFDSALPGTERQGSLRLIVHPHFGDFHQRDYLRMPLGFRYGVTDRLEVTGEVETFFAHGLGGVPAFSSVGLSQLHGGAKYKIDNVWDSGWDTAVGFDWTKPVGSPPADLTDGLKHYAPYVSLSRRLVSAPAWRVFGSLAYDEVRATWLPMTLRKNELGADAPTFSAGALFEYGAMTYTLETAWSSSRISRRFDHDVLSVRPGFVWVVPQRYTFGSEGRWLLGAGLRLSEGPDGFDIGVSMKLRANFNFKRLLNLMPRREYAGAVPQVRNGSPP